jgi:hypothetical protein
MKLYLILIIAFVCSANKIIGQTNDEQFVETIFTRWNQSTLASIDLQSKKAIYSDWRSDFEKRSKVLPTILYSPTANERDEFGKGKPDRYKFLEEIHIDTLKNKHFFIIETTLGGEVAQSRNYLIEADDHGLRVIVYVYLKNNWKMKRDMIIPNVGLHSKIRDYKKDASLDGVNDADLILTEFSSLKIQSRYYIAVSISKDDDIIRITKL